MYILRRNEKKQTIVKEVPHKIYTTSIQLTSPTKVLTFTLAVDNAKQLLEQRSFTIQLLAYTHTLTDTFSWNISCDFLTVKNLQCITDKDTLVVETADLNTEQDKGLYILEIDTDTFDVQLQN